MGLYMTGVARDDILEGRLRLLEILGRETVDMPAPLPHQRLVTLCRPRLGPLFVGLRQGTAEIPRHLNRHIPRDCGKPRPDVGSIGQRRGKLRTFHRLPRGQMRQLHHQDQPPAALAQLAGHHIIRRRRPRGTGGAAATVHGPIHKADPTMPRQLVQHLLCQLLRLRGQRLGTGKGHERHAGHIQRRGEFNL